MNGPFFLYILYIFNPWRACAAGVTVLGLVSRARRIFPTCIHVHAHIEWVGPARGKIRLVTMAHISVIPEVYKHVILFYNYV